MSRPDHAVLQNSDLNPFLYAELGIELNGSTLTMLSVLARLNQDPWIEAARWARLPKAEAGRKMRETRCTRACRRRCHPPAAG